MSFPLSDIINIFDQRSVGRLLWFRGAVEPPIKLQDDMTTLTTIHAASDPREVLHYVRREHALCI